MAKRIPMSKKQEEEIRELIADLLNQFEFNQRHTNINLRKMTEKEASRLLCSLSVVRKDLLKQRMPISKQLTELYIWTMFNDMNMIRDYVAIEYSKMKLKVNYEDEIKRLREIIDASELKSKEWGVICHG